MGNNIKTLREYQNEKRRQMAERQAVRLAHIFVLIVLIWALLRLCHVL